MIKHTLTIFILAFSSQVNALGIVVDYENVIKNHFGTIQKISSCGSYQFGEYRLIQSNLYGGSMLFVDKLKHSKTKLYVYQGYTFSEINNDHLELYIENVTCVTKGDNFVVIKGTVKGTGHSENDKYNFIINLNTENGAYNYKRIKQK